MLSKVAIGATEVPESEPGDPVVVVVPLSNSMTTASYLVELLLPVELPSANVAVTDQTATDVELTFTQPDGYAGSGLTVYLLCTEDIDMFVEGPGDISALLDAAWTGETALYKEGANAYLRVNLTATASIDGTAKFSSWPLLTGLASDYNTGLYGPSVGIGTFYDDENQLFLVISSGTDLSIQPTAWVTGTWVDGVSTLRGQISWLAQTPEPT